MVYTPPGKPQWQPIETVWGIAKSYVSRNYSYSLQNYPKMRSDLIDGFYGNESKSYKGVTPKRVRKLTFECEKLMLKWLNEFGNLDISLTDLKNYKLQDNDDTLPVAEDFQFDNSFELGGDTCLPFLEEDSSSEEIEY